MRLKELIKEPETITFITTYKCSSTCSNCCFQCSPKRNETLSLENIINCLEQVKKDFPKVKVMVLTGGECTLLKYLSELIKIAQEKYNLMIRIVTNAHWASNYEKAKKKIIEWKEAGLNEINFSTGDEHLQYVPIEYIKNAIIASVEEGFIPFVNIEALEGNKFNVNNLMNDKKIYDLIKENKVSIMNGVWIDFKNPNAEVDKSGFMYSMGQKCSNLFNNITITPDYRIKACCGITSNYIKYLDLGNLAKYSLRELYDKQFLDFMKIWLATEGAHKIMNFIAQYDQSIELCYYERKHPCQVCAMILNDPPKMDIIRKQYKSIYSNIIMKYLINH